MRFAHGPRSPLLPTDLRWFELIIDSLYFIDVILTFFIGVPSSVARRSSALRDIIDEDKDTDAGYVTDMGLIARFYFQSTFIVDIIALLPFFLHKFIYYGPEGWVWVYYLKGVRLLFHRSINRSIEEIFKRMFSNSDIIT